MRLTRVGTSLYYFFSSRPQCLNRGIMVNGLCRCPHKFAGPKCEILARHKEVMTSICSIHGTPFSDDDVFTCVCHSEDFTGAFCHVCANASLCKCDLVELFSRRILIVSSFLKKKPIRGLQSSFFAAFRSVLLCYLLCWRFGKY